MFNNFEVILLETLLIGVGIMLYANQMKFKI